MVGKNGTLFQKPERGQKRLNPLDDGNKKKRQQTV
jgi:hypothetical protein